MAVNLGEAVIKITAKLDGLVSGVNQAKGVMSKFASSLRGIGAAMQQIGFIATAMGAAIVAAFVAGAKAGAIFEDQLIRAQATMRGTQEEYRKVTEAAFEMGRTTIFTAQEAADGLLILARAGLDAEQSIAALRPVLEFALAGAIDVGTAATVLVDIARQFNLPLDDIRTVGDALVAAANNATTTLTLLQEGFKFVGATASALGQTLKGTAAALSTLNELGLKGTLGGTALNRVFIELIKKGDKLAEALQIDAALLDPTKRQLVDIIRTISEAGATATIFFDIFEVRGARAFAALASPAGVAKFETLANEVMPNATRALAEFAATMETSVIAQLKLLRSQFVAFQQTIFQLVNSEFRDLIMGLREVISNTIDWIKANPQAARSIIKITAATGALLAVLGPVAVVLGGIAVALASVIGSLTAASAAMTAASAAAATAAAATTTAATAAAAAATAAGTATAGAAAATTVAATNATLLSAILAKLAAAWGAIQGAAAGASGAVGGFASLAALVVVAATAIVGLGIAFVRSWQEIKNAASSAFAALKPILTFLWVTVRELTLLFARILTPVVKVLAGAVGVLFKILKPLVQVIFIPLTAAVVALSTGINWLLDAVGWLFKTLGTSLRLLVEWAKSTTLVKKTISGLGIAIGWLIDKVVVLWEAIKDAGAAIVRFGKWIADVTGLTKLAQNINEVTAALEELDRVEAEGADKRAERINEAVALIRKQIEETGKNAALLQDFADNDKKLTADQLKRVIELRKARIASSDALVEEFTNLRSLQRVLKRDAENTARSTTAREESREQFKAITAELLRLKKVIDDYAAAEDAAAKATGHSIQQSERKLDILTQEEREIRRINALISQSKNNAADAAKVDREWRTRNLSDLQKEVALLREKQRANIVLLEQSIAGARAGAAKLKATADAPGTTIEDRERSLKSAVLLENLANKHEQTLVDMRANLSEAILKDFRERNMEMEENQAQFNRDILREQAEAAGDSLAIAKLDADEKLAERKKFFSENLVEQADYIKEQLKLDDEAREDNLEAEKVYQDALWASIQKRQIPTAKRPTPLQLSPTDRAELERARDNIAKQLQEGLAAAVKLHDLEIDLAKDEISNTSAARRQALDDRIKGSESALKKLLGDEVTAVEIKFEKQLESATRYYASLRKLSINQTDVAIADLNRREAAETNLRNQRFAKEKANAEKARKARQGREKKSLERAAKKVKKAEASVRQEVEKRLLTEQEIAQLEDRREGVLRSISREVQKELTLQEALNAAKKRGAEADELARRTAALERQRQAVKMLQGDLEGVNKILASGETITERTTREFREQVEGQSKISQILKDQVDTYAEYLELRRFEKTLRAEAQRDLQRAVKLSTALQRALAEGDFDQAERLRAAIDLRTAFLKQDVQALGTDAPTLLDNLSVSDEDVADAKAKIAAVEKTTARLTQAVAFGIKTVRDSVIGTTSSLLDLVPTLSKFADRVGITGQDAGKSFADGFLGALRKMAVEVSKVMSSVKEKVGASAEASNAPTNRLDATVRAIRNAKNTVSAELQRATKFSVANVAGGIGAMAPVQPVAATVSAATTIYNGGDITDNSRIEITVNTVMDQQELVRKVEQMFRRRKLAAGL